MRPLLLAILVVAPVLGGDPARDARWLADVAWLGANLPVRHPDFYSIVPKTQWQQAVDGLYGAVPNMTDTEVMVGLASLVALLHDGHTALYLTQRNSTFHLLPLEFRWYRDGLFVTGAGDGYTRALGQRVVQIGDLAVDDAYSLIVPAISHENDIWVRYYSPYYLANADILQALKIAPDNASVHFMLEDLSGQQSSIDVQSFPPGQTPVLTYLPDAGAGYVPLYAQNTGLNYWFTYSESAHLLYAAYNQCANMSSPSFAQFNSDLWAKFDNSPVETMVVDLRNNSGGDSSVFDPFLTSKTQRAARFGNVRFYVIIGRRTYSSAILNAISLQLGAAGKPLKLVGEPTGGSPNSYGQVQTMALPNSQLSIGYSTRYFSFPQYPPGSMLPDVTVPLTSADYYARHDPFLAAVLADAPRNSGASSTGGDFQVANAASFRTDLPVAPGSLAALFGDFSGIASAQKATVDVNGTAASIVAAFPRQINIQVPQDVFPGLADFDVKSDGATIGAATAPVAATAPGLFMADALNSARPAAVAGDALPGAVLQMYGTGQGAASSRARVFFGSERAEVLSADADDGVPGLWKIAVRVPDHPSVAGEVPVFVTVGAAASNGVTVKVTR